MGEHYLTEQHQHTLLKSVRQILPQIHIDRPQTTTAAASTNPTTTELQKLYELFNILSGGIEMLHADAQRLTIESLQLSNQEDSQVEETINDMQYVSADGTFLWKITNCHDQMSK
jgi:hypothetical protein